jgi:hypothetical protein
MSQFRQPSDAVVVARQGTGHLTATADLPKLCIKLAKVASDHGANAINYQIFDHGTQLHIQFLRIPDAYLRMAGRRQNPRPFAYPIGC